MRQTNQGQAARATMPSSPASTQTPSLLKGAIYGMAAGMALALAIVGDLLPAAWAAGFPAGPLAFQGFLTAAGALMGALIAGVVARREGAPDRR